MNPNCFENYQPGHFFDEMFDGSKNSEAFDFYQPIYDRIGCLSAKELEEKKKQADSSFLEHGVTFTVYSDDKGTERIFPFDLIPRVIPDSEWQKVEQGLRQRILALNLFLNDVYHGAKILSDGVIPGEVVKSSAHYRKEMIGFDVPKDIYVHVCGTDLIRDEGGNYLVLEDNARCPSGASFGKPGNYEKDFSPHLSKNVGTVSRSLSGIFVKVFGISFAQAISKTGLCSLNPGSLQQCLL